MAAIAESVRDLSGDGGVLTFSKAHADWNARPTDLSTVVVNYWVRRHAAARLQNTTW